MPEPPEIIVENISEITGISIKDYLVFDDKMCYDIEEKSDKGEIKIISTNCFAQEL